MRGKAYGELWRSRALVRPKGSRVMLTLPGTPLPWVNPLSTRFWEQTRLWKAWQRGVTWPKTFDCSAMASLAPQRATASASSECWGRMARIHGQGTSMQRSPVQGWQELEGHMSAHDTRVMCWSCAFPGSTSSYTNMRGRTQRLSADKEADAPDTAQPTLSCTCSHDPFGRCCQRTLTPMPVQLSPVDSGQAECSTASQK